MSGVFLHEGSPLSGSRLLLKVDWGRGCHWTVAAVTSETDAET